MTPIETRVMQQYNNGVLIKKIKKENHLSNREYQQIFTKLKNTHKIKPRQKKQKQNDYRKKPRNYSYNHGINRFTVNYCGEYYCCFKNKKYAKRCVELLRKYNWNKKMLQDIKKQISEEIKEGLL